MGCNSSQSTDVVNTSPTLENAQSSLNSNSNLNTTSNSNFRSEKTAPTLEDTKNKIIADLDKIERVDNDDKATNQIQINNYNNSVYNEELKKSDDQLEDSKETTETVTSDDKNNSNETSTKENLDGPEVHKKHLLTISNTDL
jgi:hypothetical protein